MYLFGGAVLLLFILTLLGAGRKKRDAFAYDPVYFGLFTNTEKKFYRVLLEAVGDEFVVFGKVRIADIVRPKKGLNKESWNKMFWRTSSKHIDFYLADPRTIQPIVLIELNDRSHEKKDRASRDVMVEKIMKSAGIPLLWIPAQKQYNPHKLRETIREAAQSRKLKKRN